MGNWTDRFDPETVDEIKRYEVGEGDFLLAERLAMHKGVESVFGFHVNCLGLGKPYWEKGVWHGWNTRQTVIRRSTVTWD